MLSCCPSYGCHRTCAALTGQSPLQQPIPKTATSSSMPPSGEWTQRCRQAATRDRNAEELVDTVARTQGPRWCLLCTACPYSTKHPLSVGRSVALTGVCFHRDGAHSNILSTTVCAGCRHLGLHMRMPLTRRRGSVDHFTSERTAK